MVCPPVRGDNPRDFASGLSPVQIDNHGINRGSYISVHVLLHLLNELRNRDKMRGLPDKMRGLPSILSLFRNEFNNSVIQEYECLIIFIIRHYDYLKTLFSCVKTLIFCQFLPNHFVHVMLLNL